MTPQPPQTRRKRRRFRLTGMEMLGFMDTPGTASAPPSRIVEVPVAVTTVPSPDLEVAVEKLDKADPFIDWKPEEFGPRLTKGGVRWGLLISMLVILAGVSAIALWVYEQPRAEAREARATMVETAADLGPNLEALLGLTANLGAASLDNAAVNSGLLNLESSNRSFFAAAGRLPEPDVVARGLATSISTQISEAQKLFTEAFTYRNAVIPVLAAPTVETDPALTDLDQAARIFAEWEARLDSVRTSLPENVLPEITTRLNVISVSLPSIQQSYLDAIGTGDGEAATAAMQALERSLADTTNSLFRALQEVSDNVVRILEGALTDLESLPSLLG